MAKCPWPSLSELQLCDCHQGRGGILGDCGVAFTLSLGAEERECVVMEKHKNIPKQTKIEKEGSLTFFLVKTSGFW